jgi:hypothetical protein
VPSPCRSILLLLTFIPLAWSALAAAPVSLRITPAVAFAPASIHVFATLESNSDNRSLQVSIDSADYYRSSQVQLEGSRAPHVVSFDFRDVPDGDYKVTARLVRDSGDPEVVAGSVRLIPSGSR